MQSFKNFVTENKNTHMMHAEDAVLDRGVKGTRDVILALRSLRDMLAGKSQKAVDVTVKFDGSPAVFAGEDPQTGEFFVAKKGIFNANPKVYKSLEDVDADTSGDLNRKMRMAFTYLKDLGIKGVIQGDFMFDSGDIKTERIDGQSMIVFHPNTIAYAVPSDSDIAKTIKRAKIGIVWHTKYNGATFETMSAEFGVEIVPKLKTSKNVWMVDAVLPDLSGTATMTASETEAVTAHLRNAGAIFRKISGNTLKTIESNKQINSLINIYNNTKVRNAERITDTKKHVTGLIMWIKARYEKDIEKMKSDAGKQKKQAELDQVLSFFDKKNQKNLQLVFDLQNSIVDAKLLLINKLNTLNNIGTFVKTKSGFKATNPEGFVAIDRMEGGAVKLVDRLEFSTNNFSKDIIKGWESPSRG